MTEPIVYRRAAFTINARPRMLSTIGRLLLASALLAVPALAAEVTPERLAHPDREPHNWLMNHRSYDAQRHSPLDRINRDTVKQLKLAYALALGGTTANENLQATPLAEDGFLYVVDQHGGLSKIDARGGDKGRILWRMDPGQEKLPLSNRGAALIGNLVITAASYPARIIATDKETGRRVWTADLSDGQPNLQLTAAPLAVKDKIIVGAAGGDLGTRCFIAALDAATGALLWRRYAIPAPGEPGHETWKGPNEAWRTGGGGMWVTGSYDPETDQVIWGTGNPVPSFDAAYRPGDNLFTNSAIAWDPDSGAMKWHFQYTPGGKWDYDEAGTHILIDAERDGRRSSLVLHAGRNGFLYALERAGGRPAYAKPHMEVTWTKGIDQATGKPVDYDPARDVQIYADVVEPAGRNRTRIRRLCPSPAGGANFWPASYSPRTRLLYIPVMTGCVEFTTYPADPAKQNWRGGNEQMLERMQSTLTIADPFTGEIKAKLPMPYPNYSGALSTGGGLVFTGLVDGTFAAFDDTTFERLWTINLGVGFNAPPMTFAVDGKQYVAILSGLSGIARSKLVRTPELNEQRNQTMLFVFSL